MALTNVVETKMKQILCSIALLSLAFLHAVDPPILDLSEYIDPEKKESFLKELEYAVHEVGCFFVKDPTKNPASVHQVYEQAKVFFSLSQEKKRETLSPNGHRGYIPGESAKDENQMDFKEFYNVGRSLSPEDLKRLQYEPNIWPTEPKAFRVVMESLFKSIDTCNTILGEAFSELLEQKKRFIREMIIEGDSLMRVIHYPANPPEEAAWAGAHTDINLFTIHPPPTAAGLQVQDNGGNWKPIYIPKGMFFVHCGDMLENLSNGLCKSVVHRVIDPGLNHDRYGIAFYAHPRSDDRLDPLPCCIEKTGGTRHYANVSRIELLAERLIDLGLATEDLMHLFTISGAIEKLREVGRFSPKAEATLIEKGFISHPTDSLQ